MSGGQRRSIWDGGEGDGTRCDSGEDDDNEGRTRTRTMWGALIRWERGRRGMRTACTRMRTTHSGVDEGWARCEGRGDQGRATRWLTGDEGHATRRPARDKAPVLVELARDELEARVHVQPGKACALMSQCWRWWRGMRVMMRTRIDDGG
jgi:hypothetical protein